MMICAPINGRQVRLFMSIQHPAQKSSFFVNERARDTTNQVAELSNTQLNKMNDNWNKF